jgi:MoxR-like ATPase
MSDLPIDDVAALKGAINRAARGLADRESLVETLVLAAVAGEHVLVVGPPGTAKSEAVRRVAAELGGRSFEYLLGRFTEPNEIFGPIDLAKLRTGVVEVETTGMLPEAEIAFLDEVFLGSTAILNTLLGILNERVFRRGSTVRQCPLRLCVGATNALPDDVALAAFADRFLVRVFIEPVSDASLEDLLDAGWLDRRPLRPEPVGLGAIDRLRTASLECDLAEVRPLLGTAIRRIRAAGVPLSDRRVVRSQALVAAAAVLDGRRTAAAADLWVLPMVAPTADAQGVVRSVLADLLDGAHSAALPNAAEEYSAGSLARARRLVATGHSLLEAWSPEADRETRLRLEATLREIDASFAPDSVPDELASL